MNNSIKIVKIVGFLVINVCNHGDRYETSCILQDILTNINLVTRVMALVV